MININSKIKKSNLIFVIGLESDSGQNQFAASNSRYASPTNSTNRSTSLSTQTTAIQEILNDTSSITKQSNEELSRIIFSSTADYELTDNMIKPLSFHNSQIKTSLRSVSKRRVSSSSSSIPQEPVFMHPTVQFSTEPIDIQFGDLQWNNSVPVAVSPSNDAGSSTELDRHETEISSNVNIQDSVQNQE